MNYHKTNSFSTIKMEYQRQSELPVVSELNFDERFSMIERDIVAKISMPVLQSGVGGKMILPPHGKEFFTLLGKQFFTV